MKIQLAVIAQMLPHDTVMHTSDIFMENEHLCTGFIDDVDINVRKKKRGESVDEYLRKVNTAVLRQIMTSDILKMGDVYFAYIRWYEVNGNKILNSGKYEALLDEKITKISNGHKFISRAQFLDAIKSDNGINRVISMLTENQNVNSI